MLEVFLWFSNKAITKVLFIAKREDNGFFKYVLCNDDSATYRTVRDINSV